MTALCKRLDIDLVFIGPEAPLVAGLVDDMQAAGLKVFGKRHLGRGGGARMRPYAIVMRGPCD